MKGTDIEYTTIECILPWVMRNWAGCKKIGVVGYTSSNIDLVCTTTGYTRPISQLLGTLAVIWILCTQPLGRLDRYHCWSTQALGTLAGKYILCTQHLGTLTVLLMEGAQPLGTKGSLL